MLIYLNLVLMINRAPYINLRSIRKAIMYINTIIIIIPIGKLNYNFTVER